MKGSDDDFKEFTKDPEKLQQSLEGRQKRTIRRKRVHLYEHLGAHPEFELCMTKMVREEVVEEAHLEYIATEIYQTVVVERNKLRAAEGLSKHGSLSDSDGESSRIVGTTHLCPPYRIRMTPVDRKSNILE
jgi:hypothetical protein